MSSNNHDNSNCNRNNSDCINLARLDYIRGFRDPGDDSLPESLPSLEDVALRHGFDPNALQEYFLDEDWEASRNSFWFEVWTQYLKSHPPADGPGPRQTADSAGLGSPKDYSQHKDEHGHFKKGNPGGPGRGNGARTIKRLRQRIYALWEINPQAFEAAMVQLMSKAAQGDLESIKFLFPYILGKPDVNVNLNASVTASTVDLTRLTDEELRQCEALAAKAEVEPASPESQEGSGNE